ncbi:hypothetical protein COT72_01930 [archaeon CG10_big_fil_rev_8_21_14_0_10_43_11]|nr:MAG: hypothetical protein COT72_01930 [archaeon CG10_big_fil_rev_8_21_14_0_10_43_11]
MHFKRGRDARKAFLERDISKSIAVHQIPEEKHTAVGSYIKSAVYGGLDGIVTTFAVVAGVAGASLDASIVLILGFANLIADGISMAVGDYLSTKSEREYQQSERTREEWEMRHYPEGERNEMIDLYQQKGYEKKDAITIVDTLLKKPRAFVDTMMVDELGILEEKESPVYNALVTFGSFAAFGFIPLFSYVIALLFSLNADMFPIAIVFTAVTLFVLGALRYFVTGTNWIRAGLEMLVVGGLAAFVAYGIGAVIGALVGV